MNYIKYNDKLMSIPCLAKKHGLEPSTLRKRLKKGIPIPEALNPERLKPRIVARTMYDKMILVLLRAYAKEKGCEQVEESVIRLFKELKGEDGRPDNAK